MDFLPKWYLWDFSPRWMDLRTIIEGNLTDTICFQSDLLCAHIDTQMIHSFRTISIIKVDNLLFLRSFIDICLLTMKDFSNKRQTDRFFLFFSLFLDSRIRTSQLREWRDNDNHFLFVYLSLFFLYISSFLFSQPCSSSLVLQSLDQISTYILIVRISSPSR